MRRFAIYSRRKNQFCARVCLFTIAIMTVYGAMLGSANALLLSYLQSLHSKSPGNSCHLQIRRDLSCEGCHRPPSFRLLAVTTVESPDITWDAFTGQSSRITNDDISQKVEQFQPSSFKSLVSNGSILDQAQQLKDSVDIVSVIESYQLDGFRRMGNRATAVCPFHNDHIPSLSIDSSRRIYKCFACGAGGDVFRFVQEYSKLPGQVEKSFGEAVWQISKTFGDGSIGSSYTSKRSMEEQHELLRKKDRILLANAAAAAFYADCLKQPFAGGARYHLLSRRVSVSSILTFSMGYAPDTYYDGRRSWGDGSLVYRLRDLGFTPAEILNAGLAIRIKKSNQESKKSVLGSSEALATNDEHSAEDVDYSSLMDRFRGRLMVPILDTSGTKILAFGGRVISPPETGCVVTKLNDFKAPKYLNSPESDVFEKKKILFGQNLATNAIRDAIDSATSTPLLIVEGYMDAIALWDAGITSVVASMGTAVTLEQLEAAAKTAGTRGGRIVLCLDNDDAGVAAIERLCRNGMLSEAATKYIVAISVARLPDRVKDPAEFIEFRKAGGTDLTQVADDFRKEVIDVAVEWTEWFIQRVVAKYDVTAPRGAVGSFSNIFESVADFLATALRPADRTKRAYEVAGLLSNILAKERNSTEISSAVRIQLESDLIDLASRLSDAKEALQRRVESVSGLSTTHASSAVSALSRGYGPSSSDQDDKISKRARSRVTFDDSTKGSADNNSKSPLPGVPASRQTSARVQLKQTRAKIQRQRDVESLTPHFAGFRFSHQSDSDWLGLHVEKSRRKRQNSILLLGGAKRKGMDGEFSPLNDNIVYFNSADFNGHQFLTDDAMKAGYVSRTFKPDASVVEKGIASLVEQDIASLIVSAEDSLLRILVKRRSARTTVMNMLEARSAVSYGDEIHFSCPAKEWLFDRLVRNATTLPEETKQSSNLRSFLAQQVDVPFLAFLEVATSREGQNVTRLSAASNNGVGILAPETALEQSDLISALNKPSTESFSNTLNPGSLERYFADDLVSDDVTSDDVIVGDRADLAVQEIIVTLLWASAALKSKLIRQKLSASIAEQQSTRPRRDPATSALKRTKVADEESESMRAENANHSTNMQYIHDRNCSPRDTPELLIALNHTNLSTAESDDEKLTSELHLVTYQKELLTKLRDTARTLQSLKESAKRVNARLMDESSSTGIEGHMSAALQADLASRLDDHVRDVCHARVSPDQELHFQAKNDEPYEDALERMAEEWGVWFDDEYVWSPDDSSKSEQNVFAGSVGSNSNEPDLIERETLAEFYERIEREWQGWDD